MDEVFVSILDVERFSLSLENDRALFDLDVVSCPELFSDCERFGPFQGIMRPVV